jgi:hypothetical protein
MHQTVLFTGRNKNTIATWLNKTAKSNKVYSLQVKDDLFRNNNITPNFDSPIKITHSNKNFSKDISG